MSVYFDLYGGLLSAKQQEVYRLYYEDNLSLSEIAETFKISRQGIHESLKKAEIALKEFEDKLGLVKKDQDFNDVIKSVEDISAKILQDEAIASLKDKKDADRIRRSLKKLISVVKTIESDRIRGMHGV
ncbi:MAG: DNA-binding protein [Clostridiales Family XIII bacterium]|nr:DNA-binding protein [Clostridiales Family XIII bacterium]